MSNSPKNADRRKGNTRTIKSDSRSNTRNKSFPRGKKLPNEADKAERWEAGANNVVPEATANDPKWYNRFPGQTVNFADFNFRAPVGSKVDYGFESLSHDRFPGIMALYYAPAAGESEEGLASPLNMASNQLYQYTRFENNGSSKYDRGDLMLYLLAMDSAYMFHSYIRRLYGMITAYSNMNRYMPQALMRANRVDYDDLVQHLAEFRGYINQYADRLHQLPIPATLPYVARHQWMASHVWVDTDTYKAQLYMWVPQYFYKFGIETEDPYTGEPYLDYVNPSYGTLLTYADLRAFGDSLLVPLVANEDFNLIGSDIIKAFGTNALMRVDPIPSDYKVYPEFSEEVLDQIHNAVAVGYPACEEVEGSSYFRGHAVYWDASNNTLVPCDRTWSPYDTTQTYQILPAAFESKKLIDFTKDDISTDDVMVASRLTTYPVRGVNELIQRSYLDIHGLGSELFTQFSMFFFTDEGDGGFRIGNTTMGYFLHPTIVTMGAGSAGDDAATWQANQFAAREQSIVRVRDEARFLQALSMFRKHPQVYTARVVEFYEAGDGGVPVYKGILNTGWETTWHRIGDTANFAVFDSNDLRNLSRAALMSEFFVPLAAAGPVSV